MKWTMSVFVAVLLVLGLNTSEVFGWACLQENSEYSQCQEFPENMPLQLMRQTCEKNNGKFVGKCPLPRTDYCEIGRDGEVKIFTWGGIVTKDVCGGTWHGTVISSSEAAPTASGPDPVPAGATPVPSPGGSGVQAEQEDDYIWKLVPQRPGDKVVQEVKTPNGFIAKVSSDAAMSDVMAYYEKALTSQGWKTGSKFIQGEEGVLVMSFGDSIITIATAKGKNADGGLLYGIQLIRPIS